MKFILTILAFGALLLIAAPTAKAGGYHESRFSHYDHCGRPVFVNVYVPRPVCPPPVVTYPYCGPRRVIAPVYPRFSSGYYARPRVGFSFTYCR